MQGESVETVVVGTGFASTFFLREYLAHAGPDARVLVLERGRRIPYAQKVATRSSSDILFDDVFLNRTPDKVWVQAIGFGGSTCWTGNTPRPHPSDFETATRYGVGEDWPFGYDELEPYLAEAEDLMGIAGSSGGPFPRSRPYPTPGHHLNAFDRAIEAKYPGQHLPMPSARSSGPATGRPTCCITNACSTCPITAKFQIDLHMADLYDDPRVELRLESTVHRLEIEGDRVVGVHYEVEGADRYVGCDLAAVGAHGIFTPHILLRSGLEDPALGRYLSETFSVDVQLDLTIDSLDGSQAVSGLGVMFHDGEHRRHRATCNIESWNAPWLRAERGRWTQRSMLKFVFEDLPSPENRVQVSAEHPTLPEVFYPEVHPYTLAGFDALPGLVEELVEGLPVEDYRIIPREGGEGDAHIQGTARMGTDPATSVVDADLIHHRVRNLLALGSSAFPTCPAANPTLILSALSLRAARRLRGA